MTDTDDFVDEPFGWNDSMASMSLDEIMADIRSKLTGDPSFDANLLIKEQTRYFKHPQHLDLIRLTADLLFDACAEAGKRERRVLRRNRQEASILDDTMPTTSADTSVHAPVFSLLYEKEVRYPNGMTLMGLEITRPVVDSHGRTIDRTYVDNYPVFDSDGSGVFIYDSRGDIALDYGVDYYCEGMEYADPKDRDARISCFGAAELLFLHSAVRGNAAAFLNLGYLYSYDRCEGDYWDDFYRVIKRLPKEPFPREARAFECFRRAADAGIAEAVYKLGDLYRLGMGCEPNARTAYTCYVRALDAIEPESLSIVGSIALRLGECHEEGFGCKQSFGKALDWYERATSTLERAIEAGDGWYRRSLIQARAGIKRCRQELALDGANAES